VSSIPEDEKPVILTFEEAVAMLPDGEDIHTQRNPGIGMFIGADWSRDRLIEHIRKHGAELAGPIATAMGKGLVVKDDNGPLFVETKRETCPTCGQEVRRV
jgi:hypothetical protein